MCAYVCVCVRGSYGLHAQLGAILIVMEYPGEPQLLSLPIFFG